MTQDEIKALIAKYGIWTNGDYSTIGTHTDEPITESEKAMLRAAKPEVVAYLKDEAIREQREQEEQIMRLDRIIPGLSTLREARDAMERWHDEVERAFFEEDRMDCGPKPFDLDALHAQYPRRRRLPAGRGGIAQGVGRGGRGRE